MRQRAHDQQHRPNGPQVPLDPALVRLIEALAEAQAEDDYRTVHQRQVNDRD